MSFSDFISKTASDALGRIIAASSGYSHAQLGPNPSPSREHRVPHRSHQTWRTSRTCGLLEMGA